MNEEKIHVFEKAGLGKAPFKFVGLEYRRGPIRQVQPDGIVLEIGSPGQPMGACQFCGQGIAECCLIESSDGKTFIVGNECVRKTGDSGLTRSTRNAILDARNKARWEREGRKIAHLKELVANTDVRYCLENLKHPHGHIDFKTKAPKTAWDHVEWIMAHAGTTGKLKAYRFILAQVPGLEEVK